MPCVTSPWSPSPSPWSAVTTTVVGLVERRTASSERTERVIHICHFTGVRVAAVSRVERRRRRVARVRVEDVDPGEPLAPLLVDPGARLRDDLFGATLGEGEVSLGDAALADVAVDVEALREAELPVEGKCADECAGGQAALACDLRQCLRLLVQPVAGVVPDAVLERVASREDARMRRQGHHRMRVGEREPETTLRQSIEVRRGRASAVAPQRIGPQCVDGDEKDVLIGARNNERRRRARPRPPERSGHENERGDSESANGAASPPATSRHYFVIRNRLAAGSGLAT